MAGLETCLFDAIIPQVSPRGLTPIKAARVTRSVGREAFREWRATRWPDSTLRKHHHQQVETHAPSRRRNFAAARTREKAVVVGDGFEPSKA
jgi:hypothetical protein